jgi:hypothetical protein
MRRRVATIVGPACRAARIVHIGVFKPVLGCLACEFAGLPWRRSSAPVQAG